MLEVGNGMSQDEDESHMAMWCILAAPLIVGCDMTKMTPDTLRIRAPLQYSLLCARPSESPLPLGSLRSALCRADPSRRCVQ